MNDEEKYKKALEKAKALHGSSEPMSGCSVILETIFPELKENEDEKILVIIKHCIECRYRETHIIQGISLEQCFAWLEKHGEKKPVDSHCQENCKGFQKTGKCFTDGECEAKKEAEQKPVWSENDERICRYLIRKQEELIDTVDNPILKQIYRERMDWLKSLESRVQAQNTEKEVDLDEEFDKCCENYTFDDECEVHTAKHFFKLGFKVQKGE